MRAPTSQPVGIHTTMEILHEIGAHDDPMIGAAADWLATITRDDGGIPFVLEDAMAHPHAPWWQHSDESSVTQTAANAAALHHLERRRTHGWSAPTSSCFAPDRRPRRSEHLTSGSATTSCFSVAFLDAHADDDAPSRRSTALAAASVDPRGRRALRPPSSRRRSTSPRRRARAAAGCSTARRSNATSTPSKPASRATAAGPSHGRTGTRRPPSSGAASPPSRAEDPARERPVDV